MGRWSPAENIGFLLHDTSRLMRKRFDQKSREFDLTRAQWRVLVNLDREPGLKQAALAEIMEVEPITLCRIIDRMEEAGWVRREVDPQDRRAKLLFMTEQAEPVMGQLWEIAMALDAEVWSGIDREERRQFISTLMQIRRNISDAASEEGTPSSTSASSATPSSAPSSAVEV